MFNSFQNFDPSNAIASITGILYYLFIAATLFFSISTTYTLVKYSRTRGVGFVVSILYLIFYFELVNQGLIIINSMK